MAKLGQIIYPISNAQSESFMEFADKDYISKEESYQGFKYYNVEISYPFDTNKDYAIKVEGKDEKDHGDNYNLFLTFNNDKDEQFISTFNSAEESQFSFSPRLNFNKIVITKNTKSYNNVDGWDTNYQCFSIKIKELNNLVQSGQNWSRVGVQAFPGTHFMINKEDFMVGKTGVFELTDKIIDISAFSVIDENKPCIIDYQTDLDNISEEENGSNPVDRTVTILSSYGSVLPHYKIDNNTSGADQECQHQALSKTEIKSIISNTFNEGGT